MIYWSANQTKNDSKSLVLFWNKKANWLNQEQGWNKLQTNKDAPEKKQIIDTWSWKIVISRKKLETLKGLAWLWMYFKQLILDRYK